MSTPQLRQLLAVFAALATCLGLFSFAAPAEAQTDEIEDTRQRAAEAAQAVSDAETALGEMDSEIAQLEAQAGAAQRELDRLGSSVQQLVIGRYMSSGDMPMLTESNLNDGVKAQAYSRYIGQDNLDSIDQYLAAKAELDDASSALTAKRAEQEERIEDLESAVADVQAELERLEELERQRQVELERQRQAEAERAAAAAAAQAAADRAAAQRQVQPQSQSRATQPASQAAPAPTATPAPPTHSGGGLVCPVAGPHTFIDSWGAPRSGGRTHKGVDMMASHGTPAVAPVSGVVTHRGNTVGGLSYHLDGDDGNYYYGTHLSSYAQGGRVSAGTVIGYVGSTGNAGSPHLHFEIHPNASSYSTPVNPYPATKAACG